MKGRELDVCLEKKKGEAIVKMEDNNSHTSIKVANIFKLEI